MSKNTEDLLDGVIKASKTHVPIRCAEDECLVCGYMICPQKCLEHFLHDGCPVCLPVEERKPKERVKRKN